jgi:ornithine carbamoyltransferase
MNIDELTDSELRGLLSLSAQLKATYKSSSASPPSLPRPLLGKSISMIFQKRSTRTRVSTETGMAMLGGHALFLGPQDIQLGVNESMRDTAAVLSRFNSLLLARVFAHPDVQMLAKHSSVPVINALSDLYHPLQALADLLTLEEHFGEDGMEGKVLAWVGDGNNVLHDLAMGAVRLGMHVRVACPEGYEPDAEVMKKVKGHAERKGGSVTMTREPMAAVEGANVVVTDTWVSMGQEEEYEKRMRDFEGFQVTRAMMEKGAKVESKGGKAGCVFLHCLPRHSEEVTDEVFYDQGRSLVFPEAENRMWTVMAVMLSLVGK